MIKRLISVTIFSLIVVAGFSMAVKAQNSSSVKITAKVTGEHRDNVNRVPDSSKFSDYRTNYLFLAEYRNRFYKNIRSVFLYDGRYHRYNTRDTFNRHDHRFRMSFSKAVYKKLRISIEEDLRLRFHTSLSSINHQRNIIDFSLKLPVFSKGQLVAGYQNWAKRYPDNELLQRFQSNRYYLKFSRQIVQRTNVGLKYTLQSHRGNLFPGSTAPDQQLREESIRHVVNFTIDRIINRRLFIGAAYRYEDDEPDEPDFDEFGRRLNDEEAEELLTDDADFGYDKHQFSLSSVVKFNSRISLITFYLIQFKQFDEWEIFEDGPDRNDDLIFLSNLLRIDFYKDFGLQLRYNFENNNTNLSFYKYRLNAISAGLYWQL